MSWLQADRPRSEAGQLLSGLLGGIVGGVAYVLIVGDQRGTIVIDPMSFDRPTMAPLGVVLAPIVWWLAGAAAATLAWIVVGERRLPDRPRLRLQSRHRAIPAVAATLFCNVGLAWALRPGLDIRSGYNEDLTEFTWSVSPMPLVLTMTVFMVAWLGVYAAGRFIMGDDPDDEPLPATDPDPAWEARRRQAADAMRGRGWPEP